MFTGLIEQKGVISSIQNQDTYQIAISANFSNLQIGESIAVNGVCLTLLGNSTVENMLFDVSPETLDVTNLQSLLVGSSVNLERAMLASTRFGGHYVTGHVDKTVKLLSSSWVDDEYLELRLDEFCLSDHMYLLNKGSITINGVSLTINAVIKNDNSVCISLLLVPHTLTHTALGLCKVGDLVNVEFDYLTRIVEHQLRIKNHDSCV